MSALSALKIPVFWAEGQPEIRSGEFVLTIGGLVARPCSLDLKRLEELGTDVVSGRLTSVTRWSVRLTWRGILMGRLIGLSQPLEEARFVKLASFSGGYTTVVAREDIEHPRALIALAAEGESLPVEYGGPARAFFPHLWGYKSAKSLVRLDFQDRYEAGYWENKGYDNGGRIEACKLFDLNSCQTRFHPGGEIAW